MMLAANGLSIIVDSLSTQRIVLSFVESFLAISPIAIRGYLDFSRTTEFILIILSFIFFQIYYQEMIKAVNNANSFVLAHLFLISQSGIDSKTTPIFKKYKLFQTISHTALFYFILFFSILIIAEVFWFPVYLYYSLFDALNLLVMAAAAWIFKLKKQLTNGYMMIGDDGNNQATFSMEDIRNLSIDQEIFNQGTTWEEGMPLPPQPSIVTEKTENHQKDEIETKKEEEEKNENVDAASNEML